MQNYVFNFAVHSILQYVSETNPDFISTNASAAKILHQPDAITSIEDINRLLVDIEHQSSPMAPLYAGLNRKPTSYGLISDLARMQQNFSRGHQLVADYLALVTDVIQFEASVSSNNVDFYITNRSAAEAAFIFFTEYFFSGEFTALKHLSGNPAPFTTVHFQSTPRKGLTEADYEQWFNCSVLFEQERNKYSFDTSKLKYPASPPNPDIAAMLQKKADALLSQIQDRQCIVERTKTAITCSLNGEVLTFEQAARDLNLSPKTLQRKLKDKGVTFSLLLNQTRLHSFDCLISNSTSMKEIAYQLGFCNHRSFNRWVKTQTGLSPSECRERHLSKTIPIR